MSNEANIFQDMEELSWGQKLALMEHYTPSVQVACKVFNATEEELKVATELLSKNMFQIDNTIDMESFKPLFLQAEEIVAEEAKTVISVPVKKTIAAKPTPTVSQTRPESASKAIKVKPAPMKRGRKGTKIKEALMLITSTPVPLSKFCLDNGVSEAVMKQSKRFVEQIDEYEPGFAKQYGNVVVRTDKATKQLMIWRAA